MSLGYMQLFEFWGALCSLYSSVPCQPEYGFVPIVSQTTALEEETSDLWSPCIK